MAQSLASAGPASNVTQATFLDFLGKYDDADALVADAVNERKDLRKAIKGAGINLAAFDRARIDADKSGDKREAEELEYRRYMAWRNKPVGFQPSMDLAPSDPMAALSTYTLHQIDTEGFAAGKGGKTRTINSYTPGTEAWSRWDTAWVRGQADNAAGLAKTPEAAAAARAAGEPAPKRGRGRPRKEQAAPAGSAMQGFENGAEGAAGSNDNGATKPARRSRAAPSSTEGTGEGAAQAAAEGPGASDAVH